MCFEFSPLKNEREYFFFIGEEERERDISCEDSIRFVSMEKINFQRVVSMCWAENG